MNSTNEEPIMNEETVKKDHPEVFADAKRTGGLIKTMTIDGFYTRSSAKQIGMTLKNANFDDFEFGQQIRNFNLLEENIEDKFNLVIPFKEKLELRGEKEESGVFRIPKLFIHFERFENALTDWLFCCALEPCVFNVFEHRKTGAKSVLDLSEDAVGMIGYRNLFEWDLKVNHLLEPGQGIFFRPWLFHSFDKGLIQMFQLRQRQRIEQIEEK